jgi:hypothetical protein
MCNSAIKDSTVNDWMSRMQTKTESPRGSSPKNTNMVGTVAWFDRKKSESTSSYPIVWNGAKTPPKSDRCVTGACTDRKHKKRPRDTEFLTSRDTSRGSSQDPNQISKSIISSGFLKPTIEKAETLEVLGGLGMVYFTNIKKKQVRVREINIKNISSFIINEIPGELRKWEHITKSCSEIVGTYQASTQDNHRLLLISSYDPSLITLTEYLKTYGKGTTQTEKLRLLKSIVKILRKLVSNSQPPISHGHLTPYQLFLTKKIRNNILVSKDLVQVKIIDIGFDL